MKKKKHISEKNYNDLSEVYFSILQFGFNGYLEITSKSVRNQFSASRAWQRLVNIIGRIIALPIRAVYYPFKFRKHLNYNTLQNKPWLLITSNNNRSVLKILKERIPESVYLTYEAAVSDSDDIVPLTHLRIWSRLYRFPFIYYQFKKKYGKKAWWYTDYVFKAVGQYEACRHFIQKHRPAYIVFANDHSIFPRAMLLAAKSLNVPTIYIQHASVTPYFPPLDFDLSLLEGQATLDRYAQNGEVKGEVRFIGMPKFDPYVSLRNTQTQVQRVGICCNKLDETADVEVLVAYLKSQLPQLTFTFRPHPADERNFSMPEGVLHSTKAEKAFDFLQQQDLIIAGNTSIHLEAVLLNVLSVYYEFSDYSADISDMYGYCKNGLTERADTREQLLQIIENQINNKEKDIFKKATYYNHTAGTAQEGSSSELAVQYIRQFVNKQP